MSNIICEFCNKQFTNIYILKNHLKSSKKCISQRTDIKIDITEYNCEWCNKSFLRKDLLNIHSINCKINPSNNNICLSLQNENNNYKNEIEKLKKQIKEQQEKHHKEIILIHDKYKDELKEQHDKFIEELLLTQEKYREEKQLLKDENLVLKTEIRMINENIEVLDKKEDKYLSTLDKKEDKYLGTIKDVAVKPSTNNKITNNTVNKFEEKNQLNEGWINGGFFVFEPEIFDFIKKGDSTILEHDVLPVLSKKKFLKAYKHQGFWQCMDNLRDKKLLEKFWKQKNPPWKVWK